MAWVRIDDDLFSHPKILRAWWTDKASIGLWPQGLSWAGRQLTDGYVSAEFVRGLLPNRREREREQTLARRDADAARKRTPR
jgi:hypothetical protein